MDDLKLFNGIVSDLFPKIKFKATDYGDMEKSFRNKANQRGLEDVDGEGVRGGEGERTSQEELDCSVSAS